MWVLGQPRLRSKILSQKKKTENKEFALSIAQTRHHRLWQGYNLCHYTGINTDSNMRLHRNPSPGNLGTSWAEQQRHYKDPADYVSVHEWKSEERLCVTFCPERLCAPGLRESCALSICGSQLSNSACSMHSSSGPKCWAAWDSLLNYVNFSNWTRLWDIVFFFTHTLVMVLNLRPQRLRDDFVRM